MTTDESPLKAHIWALQAFFEEISERLIRPAEEAAGPCPSMA